MIAIRLSPSQVTYSTAQLGLCQIQLFLLSVYFQLKSAATDDALRLVVNAVDPITLEDGSSILLAAGINSNPRKSDVPAIVRRLTKFYALGMFR